MNKICLAFFFTAIVSSASYSQDSVQALFNKKPELSFMSWDLGYAAMTWKSKLLQGFSYHFGFAFSHISFGLGVDHASARGIYLPQFAYQPVKPRLNYSLASFNLEYLANPNKLINFSIPARICWGISSYRETAFKTPSQPSWDIGYDDFFVGEAGANLFLNVFKGMSVGIGGMYRYASGADTIGNDSEFSGLTLNAFLRFKTLTKEWREKQKRKQQEWMQKFYQQQRQ